MNKFLCFGKKHFRNDEFTEIAIGGVLVDQRIGPSFLADCFSYGYRGK